MHSAEWRTILSILRHKALSRVARKFKSQYKKVNFLWFKATFLKINYIFLIKVGMLYKIDYGHFARPPLLQVLPY